MLKGMLQSPRFKDYIKNISIDQSLSNSALLENICLQNINKLYQHDGTCDDQQQFKDILDAPMVSTPEVFNNNNTRSPMNPTQVKKPSARTSLCLFTNILDVKNKTSIRQIEDSKSKCKSIKSVTTLWAMKTKRKGNSKSIIR